MNAGPLKVSILVPLYNEEEFIAALLERVLAAPLGEALEREIIVVDDGSTDGCAEIVDGFSKRFPAIRLFRHQRNQGKGAAIRTALAHALGDVCLIQDADLEYDPREYPKLLNPICDDRADVVFGSRFLVSGERRVLYFWHSIANRVLTGLCNVAADLNLTDMGTGYKAFRTSLLRSIPIRSNGFGIEPELTIKVARREARIYETPVSYHGRTYDEGKKIRPRHALQIAASILRYAITQDLYRDSGHETLEALASAPRFNAWMADTIRPYVGKRVLEIGAGIGNLTRLLVPRRQFYVASDIEPEHLARLKSRLQHRPNLCMRRCDLASRSDFEPLAGLVDTVICLNVLEHVENDTQALANMKVALEPGGRAIILVPHGNDVFGTLDSALGHFRRYRHEELRAKLESTGFHVERILDFNRVSRPAWSFAGRVLKRQTLDPLTLRLFDRFVWLWRRIDGLLPWPPTSIIAIAVKP